MILKSKTKCDDSALNIYDQSQFKFDHGNNGLLQRKAQGKVSAEVGLSKDE